MEGSGMHAQATLPAYRIAPFFIHVASFLALQADLGKMK